MVTEVAGQPVTSAKEAAAAIAKEPADKILLLYVNGPGRRAVRLRRADEVGGGGVAPKIC